jgi:hypothetical protein
LDAHMPIAACAVMHGIDMSAGSLSVLPPDLFFSPARNLMGTDKYR